MSTPADVLSDVASAFEALSGTRTRMASDYRRDMETIAVGATKYQLRLVPAGRDSTNSNATRTMAALELEVDHRLVDATDEQAYTAGAMQTDLESLTASSWWRSLASIYAVTDITASVERVGHVVVYVLTVSFVIQN